jgi:hypothetical protein
MRVDGTGLNRRSGEQGAPVPRDLFPRSSGLGRARGDLRRDTLLPLRPLPAREPGPRLVRPPVSRCALRLGGGTYLAGVRAGAVAVGDPRHPHDQEPHEDHRGPRTIQPSARRLAHEGTTWIYVAQRLPGEPVNEAGVGTLSPAEVKRRLRWLPPASLRHMGRTQGRGPSLTDRG